MVNSMIDIPRKGLVLYLDLTEDTGNIIYDRSGHGNNARVYGAVLLKQLPFRGRFFDGVDDYGLVDPFSVNSQNVTVIAMIKFISLVSTAWDWNYAFRLPFSSFQIIATAKPSAHQIQVGTAGAGYDYRYTETAVLNEWQVWAVQITGGNTLNVFKNGSKVFTYSKTYPDENSVRLELAANPDFVSNTRGNVEIAYVLIYNRALSSREIKKIYEELQKRVTRRFVTYSDIRVR